MSLVGYNVVNYLMMKYDVLNILYDTCDTYIDRYVVGNRVTYRVIGYAYVLLKLYDICEVCICLV